jgi:hypothetical protein
MQAAAGLRCSASEAVLMDDARLAAIAQARDGGAGRCAILGVSRCRQPAKLLASQDGLPAICRD